MNDAGDIQLFNFATMSGVYPGSRTQNYQRIRLLPLQGDSPAACWALIFWHEEPPACVIVRQDPETQQLEETPLLRIENPQTTDLNARLLEEMDVRGWRVLACGACAHWRILSTRTEAGLQVGTCALRPETDDLPETPEILSTQSHLSLACVHWHAASTPREVAASHTVRLQALPRAAVVSDSKLGPWRRWQRRLGRRLRPSSVASGFDLPLIERSGVGAGTEPCFVCQGRIANLGALTVESAEGDKETFSIWRCRACFTLYLSDWTDRWERVDSLETEEAIYRVAPLEALECLALFASVPAGDHPQGRQQRGAQRNWVHGQMTGRQPLSRIVKQGR